MSTRVGDQIDDWTAESFSGGYRKLHSLADREFSGVVRAGGAELYMTRGVVVGVQTGAIEDFEDASGTIYEAPADALPLLAIMQEQNVEVRAKYYSEKTSIAKVDQTLSDGGFTGYIELSENVLSGDYYLVYQAGKSMSVAFVGESGKLIQEQEAFETADNEVGIFKVRQVDINPIEIPEVDDPVGTTTSNRTDHSGPTSSAEPGRDGSDQEPTTQTDTPTSTGTQGGDGRVSEQPTDTDTTERAGESSDTATTDRNEQTTGTAATGQSGQRSSQDDRSSEPAQSDRGERRSGSATGNDTDPTSARTSTEPRDESTGTAADDPSSPDPTGRLDADSQETNRQQTSTTPQQDGYSDPIEEESSRESTGQSQPRESHSQPTGSERQTEQERQQRTQESTRSQPQSGQRQTARRDSSGGTAPSLETKSIPSIDPSNTSVPDETPSETQAPPSPVVEDTQQREGNSQRETAREQPGQPTTQPQETAEQSQSPPPVAEPSGQPPAEEGQTQPPAVDSERLSELESKLEQKDETIDQLESELRTATGKRQELESQIEQLETERDNLASEVERLETELEQLESELGAAANAERRLTGEEALAGTDIFVRYRSKGKATLKKAHSGSSRKEEVNENLRLEKHTQFDADSVSAGGEAYDEFLEGTLEFQFVRWVVRELLFEIRETGHEKALSNLYDVLPLIDRAELSAVVEVTYTEDGQETKSQESFDVVLRDRMGHPLLAANLNDSREATTEAMMERLITSAERVGRANDDFSAAFLVTESFFDPGALEITSQATQGGLLSRDKRKSFVNLSRKQGYHLCLVEARSENFHLAVPEL